MATGKIVRVNLDKNFGFLRPDDGSAEIHFTVKQNGEDVAGQLRDGMQLQYELEVPQRGKSPHALNWSTVGAQAAQTSRRAPPGNKETLEVSFRTDEPIPQENLMLVRTFITFKRGGESVHDLPVTLFISSLKKGTDATEKQQVMSPSKRPMTLGDGTVQFSVYMPSDIETCDLIAKVGAAEYVHRWSKSKAQTEPTEATQPVQPVGPTKVERIGFDRNTGLYTFSVSNAPPGAEVRTKSDFEVETTPANPIVGNDCKLEFQLRVKTERARGAVRFGIGEFESDRFYLVHPLPPEASKPSATRT